MRDSQLVAFEKQFQQAIRDAVSRPSRKPFAWGGLAGYKQLSAIADGIRQLVDETPETHYLRRLLSQVERAVDTYRASAHDLAAAHDWLRRVAAVLHYPHPADEASSEDLTSDAVAQEMEQLIAAFQPDFKRQPAQRALYHALFRTWHAFAQTSCTATTSKGYHRTIWHWKRASPNYADTSAASPDTRPPENSDTWGTTRFSSTLRAQRNC